MPCIWACEKVTPAFGLPLTDHPPFHCCVWRSLRMPRTATSPRGLLAWASRGPQPRGRLWRKLSFGFTPAGRCWPESLDSSCPAPFALTILGTFFLPSSIKAVQSLCLVILGARSCLTRSHQHFPGIRNDRRPEPPLHEGVGLSTPRCPVLRWRASWLLPTDISISF